MVASPDMAPDIVPLRGSRPPRVVIIGGGACGMSAAWELAEHGVLPTVLEREVRPGGLCATHERGGYRFDLGGHRFISRSGELVRRVTALLGEELLVRQRSSVILHGGRRYQYPLAAENLLRNLRPTEGLRAVASFLSARAHARLSPPPDRSFEDWVTARFGRYLYDLFFGPYTEKLWGIPPSQLSADWAAERISLLDLGQALRALLGVARGRPRTYARRYYYPRLGIGHLFEAMANDITARGATLRLGAQVTGLARDRKGRVGEVRYRDADGREQALPCDYLISTAGLETVARWLRPGDAAVGAHAAALRYRAVRFLNIPLERPEVSPHTWMYVSEPRHLATRIQEPRHRSPDMAPPGRSSLMLEIPCDVGDAVWRAGDEELLSRCVRDLEELGVRGVFEEARGVFSTFVEQGYPVYDLGYRQHRDALLFALASSENVLSCGRQGTFRYIFMDVAMEMGIAAARQVLAGAPRQASLSAFRDERALVETQSVTA